MLKKIDNILFKPKSKICIFVSSTFTDTDKERSLLHEEILPHLQSRAREEGIMALFYDMRFGIKDSSTKDHSIWSTCQEAISECFEQSDGLYFISLQGEKYGYRPLPKLVDKTVFDKAMGRCENESLKQLASKWYMLNENHQIARYELKDLLPENEEEYWRTVLRTLREQFFGPTFFDVALPGLVVDHSITEWESIYANELRLQRKEEGEGRKALWIRREFDSRSLEDLQSLEPKEAAKFRDALDSSVIEQRLSDLKSFITTNFELLHPIAHETLSVKDYVEHSSECFNYLTKWKISVTNRLEAEIEDCKEKKREWTRSQMEYWELPIEYIEEILHRHFFAQTKASTFIGREDLLQEAENTIKSVKGESSLPIAAAVIGQSGAGKTLLMSKLATLMEADCGREDLPIIVRFCGTSRFSMGRI